MVKKGQTGVIVFMLISLLFVLVMLLWVLWPNNNGPTGNPIVDNPPRLVVTNGNDCLNQKDSLFGFKEVCRLEVRNLEDKPVEIHPKFECNKLSTPHIKETIQANKDAIPSKSSKFFEVKYENNGREWSCQIVDFNVKGY